MITTSYSIVIKAMLWHLLMAYALTLDTRLLSTIQNFLLKFITAIAISLRASNAAGPKYVINEDFCRFCKKNFKKLKF